MIDEEIDSNEVPITPQEFNDIVNLQSNILTMIASRDNSKDILSHLCKLAESLLPNSVASVMLKNQNTGLLSVLCAPSVPEAGHQALKNLKPSPGGGSCGNAVFRNEAQYVQNTFTDPRWEDLRQAAIDFNLCSCWSMPVRNENNEAIGTFALSSFEHRSPALFHKKLLETGASIVNIILKNKEDEKRVKLFSTAMQNASEGIIITDAHNRIIEVNLAFEEIYGYKEEELLGHNPSVFSSGLNSKEYYDDMWEGINNENKWSGEIINRGSNGSKIIQWISISSLDDSYNDENNYLAIFSDLTQLKDSQNQVQKMLYTDNLTSLHNKAYLENKIDKTKKQSLILINVNNFGYINTAYGFEMGDKILIEISRLLYDYCTASTTARINSDEFALLYNEDIDIQHKIQRIQNYFQTNQIKINDIFLSISFSYGASFSEDNLFRNAAIALKKAKEIGKNKSYVYNHIKDSVDNEKKDTFIIANNILHDALNNDKIVPFFQGIRDNVSKKILKYEALARIVDNGEVISPLVFLKAAKLSGMLPQITKIIIDKTFKIMTTNTFTFSINISEDDLSHDYLLEYLDSKLEQYNIPSSRVVLEILEGVSSDGKKNHIQQLKALKQKGFSIAIDDFGTEYSNFERVLDLEIDYLKIDAKYIKDIHMNTKSFEITRAISYFAKNAGIPCIAEFVHNTAVQSVIDELDIEYSQGYLFSEPTPL